MSAMLFSQSNVDYYFSKKVDLNFEKATEKVKEELKKQGFGVITEIDMDEKLKEKLDDIDVKPYRLLGACNPAYAYETMKVEENIGLFLPCKVIIKYVDENKSEVVMINPSAMMKMLGNDELMPIADDVTKKFKKALDAI